MPVSVTPEQFIRKWTGVTLSERSAAQQHFLDICALLGEPAPVEVDPSGETFTFEKGGTTATGGHGWADVWKKNCFAWEYKGPGKDLNAAYLQLKKYADMLDNPPLLITSDTKRIEIHTNFTNTVKVMHALDIADLADPAKREMLRAAFIDPEKLRPGVTRQQVTTEVAKTFSELAHHLQAKGYEPKRVAHFLNRIVFCMFAEDVGLLPNKIFSRLATASVAHPDKFQAHAQQLFAGMAKGGSVAFEVIDWFNGGLFDDDATLPLDLAELQLVLKCAELDWSNIEPSIFGTLFERGLDPNKRSQQGAHYTDPETIMKIVRPVVLEPWEREWDLEKTALAKMVDRAKKTISEAARQRYYTFLERLANFKVLDPACGSGNFLYVALRGLKDFEKRVTHEAEALGLPQQFPRVGPEAVLGIEVNEYAAELARVTIWIGELQWMIENGFGASKNPILKPLDQIECRDAICSADGSEAIWPKANVIIGNPPFLGDRKLTTELGVEYVQLLRAAFSKSITGSVDLVCYWFDKSLRQLVAGNAERVGLVATNSIRGGSNRQVLDAIVHGSRIFQAWSDQPWVLDGAAVRVSIVCFGNSDIGVQSLDGLSVAQINADLTGTTFDLTRADALPENKNIAFNGIQKTGPFEVGGHLAREWLTAPTNPNGRTNADVLRPYWNGLDVTRRLRDSWIVDFSGLSDPAASLFEGPYRHILATVKPARAASTVKKERDKDWLVKYWWLFWRPRPELAESRRCWSRVIVTPEVSKHRIFVWAESVIGIDKNLIAISRDDDVTFGILHSRIHELWALRLGTSLEDRPRYTPSTAFETFPFPDGLTPDIPAVTYADNPRATKVAVAAKQLNLQRETWLNPPELIDPIPEVVSGYPIRMVEKNEAAGAELKKRTLTNLYNARPTWLQYAHRELDVAVSAAYGWEWPLPDDEILKRLFELNQQRARPMDVRPSDQKREKQLKPKKKIPR
jgi:hypothetical protein